LTRRPTIHTCDHIPIPVVFQQSELLQFYFENIPLTRKMHYSPTNWTGNSSGNWFCQLEISDLTQRVDVKFSDNLVTLCKHNNSILEWDHRHNPVSLFVENFWAFSLAFPFFEASNLQSASYCAGYELIFIAQAHQKILISNFSFLQDSPFKNAVHAHDFILLSIIVLFFIPINYSRGWLVSLFCYILRIRLREVLIWVLFRKIWVVDESAERVVLPHSIVTDFRDFWDDILLRNNFMDILDQGVC